MTIERDFGQEKFRPLEIYIGKSLAGGREFEKQVGTMAKHLEKMGHTITSKDVVDWKHQEELRAEAQLSGNRDRYIFNHHLRELEESDIAIFEISQSSSGVGWEDCYMAYVLRRPVILLRHKASTYHSATLWGDPSPLVGKFEYDDGDYQQVLETALKWVITEAREVQAALHF